MQTQNVSKRMDDSSLSVEFKKAKTQALKVLLKDLEKYSSEYTWKSFGKIQVLESFPTIHSDLRGVDVAAKAKLLKKYLVLSFPENKWTIKIDRYSGGSCIDAHYTGPKILEVQLRGIEHIYQDDGKTDIQSDYFDVDNYCSIAEDGTQRLARLEKCPKCAFCGGQSDRIAITANDEVICQVCFNSGRTNTFKKLVHEVEGLE